MRSRVVHLNGGQRRQRSANLGTVRGCSWERPALEAHLSFRELFLEHYGAMRPLGLRFAHPGLAIVAVDRRRGVAGSLWLEGRPATPATAVIGRHSEADLFLDGDPELSLRHLLVMVHPLTGWSSSDVCFDVVDLRTEASFEDERGRRLEGLTAEGPVFVRCSSYALFFFVTGDPTDWPAHAEQAWEIIPDRVFVDEHDAEPDRWKRRRPQRPDGGREGTFVTRLGGPQSVLDDLASDGPAVARLDVRSDWGRRVLPVGSHALDRGVLVGRYARCDAPALFSARAISRVHLLIRRLAGSTYAIDTASTFHTYHAAAGSESSPDRVRLARLEDGDRLLVARDAVELRWQQERSGSV